MIWMNQIHCVVLFCKAVVSLCLCSAVDLHRCQDKEETVTVINVYCPRADPEKPERKQFKLQFYRLLQSRAEAILKDGRWESMRVSMDWHSHWVTIFSSLCHRYANYELIYNHAYNSPFTTASPAFAYLTCLFVLCDIMMPFFSFPAMWLF